MSKRYSQRLPLAPPKPWPSGPRIAHVERLPGQGEALGQEVVVHAYPEPRVRGRPRCQVCAQKYRPPKDWAWPECPPCKNPKGRPSNRMVTQALLFVRFNSDDGWIGMSAALCRRFGRVLAEGYSAPVLGKFLRKFEKDMEIAWDVRNQAAMQYALAHLIGIWKAECNPSSVDKAVWNMARAATAKGFIIRFIHPWKALLKPIPRERGEGRVKRHSFKENCECIQCAVKSKRAMASILEGAGKPSLLKVRNQVRKHLKRSQLHPTGGVVKSNIIQPIGVEHKYDPRCGCYYCSGVLKPIKTGVIHLSPRYR